MKTNRLLAALLFAVAIPWTAFSGYLLVLQLLDTARTGASGGYAVMFAIPPAAGAYCLWRTVEMWRRPLPNQPPPVPASPPANHWALPVAVFLGLSFVLPFTGLPHPYHMVLGLVGAVIAFQMQRPAQSKPPA